LISTCRRPSTCSGQVRLPQLTSCNLLLCYFVQNTGLSSIVPSVTSAMHTRCMLGESGHRIVWCCGLKHVTGRHQILGRRHVLIDFSDVYRLMTRNMHRVRITSAMCRDCRIVPPFHHFSLSSGHSRPVDRNVSPSWLSPGWFVARLTVAQLVCRPVDWRPLYTTGYDRYTMFSFRFTFKKLQYQ